MFWTFMQNDIITLLLKPWTSRTCVCADTVSTDGKTWVLLYKVYSFSNRPSEFALLVSTKFRSPYCQRPCLVHYNPPQREYWSFLFQYIKWSCSNSNDCSTLFCGNHHIGLCLKQLTRHRTQSSVPFGALFFGFPNESVPKFQRNLLAQIKPGLLSYIDFDMTVIYVPIGFLYLTLHYHLPPVLQRPHDES